MKWSIKNREMMWREMMNEKKKLRRKWSSETSKFDEIYLMFVYSLFILRWDKIRNKQKFSLKQGRILEW